MTGSSCSLCSIDIQVQGTDISSPHPCIYYPPGPLSTPSSILLFSPLIFSTPPLFLLLLLLLLYSSYTSNLLLYSSYTSNLLSIFISSLFSFPYFTSHLLFSFSFYPFHSIILISSSLPPG